jgi:DNA-binding NarL/FixJ family response regulator
MKLNQFYNMPFTIALVEDNLVNKNTFLQKIEQLQQFQLVFTASDGHQCLSMLKGLPEFKLPQVIFMDLEMPRLNGIETIALAKAIYPHIHFVVLTVFDDDDKIFEAIKAGASGYLMKHEGALVLYDAVLNVLEQGGAPMSPAIARKALQLLSHTERSVTGEGGHLPEAITEREKEILQYTVTGWDAKRIAAELRISTLTVRKHIANIYEKLHVQSKAQIIRMAHKNKWFTP